MLSNCVVPPHPEDLRRKPRDVTTSIETYPSWFEEPFILDVELRFGSMLATLQDTDLDVLAVASSTDCTDELALCRLRATDDEPRFAPRLDLLFNFAGTSAVLKRSSLSPGATEVCGSVDFELLFVGIEVSERCLEGSDEHSGLNSRVSFAAYSARFPLISLASLLLR